MTHTNETKYDSGVKNVHLNTGSFFVLFTTFVYIYVPMFVCCVTVHTVRICGLFRKTLTEKKH